MHHKIMKDALKARKGKGIDLAIIIAPQGDGKDDREAMGLAPEVKMAQEEAPVVDQMPMMHDEPKVEEMPMEDMGDISQGTGSHKMSLGQRAKMMASKKKK